MMYLIVPDGTRPEDLAHCETCGALVVNTTAHDNWHARLEELARRRV